MQRLILTRLRHQTWAHVDPASVSSAEWWHSVQLMGPGSDKLLSYFQSKHNWSFWLSSNLNSVRLVLVNTGQLIVLIAGILSRNILCVHPQQCDTKTATNPSLTQSGVVAIVDSEEVCSGISEFCLNAPSDSFPLRATMAVRSVPRNTTVLLSGAQH